MIFLNYHENDFLYYPKTIDKCYFSEYNTKKGLANIQLHNKVEELNTLNYIVSDFIRIVLRKGYSFKFWSKRKKAEEIDYETRKQGINRVGILDYQEYQDLQRGGSSRKFLPLKIRRAPPQGVGRRIGRL